MAEHTKTLNESFDDLAVTALRVKRERDALLEACEAAVFAITLEGRLNSTFEENIAWKNLKIQIMKTIALAEGKDVHNG